MKEKPTIHSGAIISTVFSIRPFAMAKDKYGLTYTLISDIVVYSSGNGRQDAPLSAIENTKPDFTASTTKERMASSTSTLTMLRTESSSSDQHHQKLYLVTHFPAQVH